RPVLCGDQVPPVFVRFVREGSSTADANKAAAVPGADDQKQKDLRPDSRRRSLIALPFMLRLNAKHAEHANVFRLSRPGMRLISIELNIVNQASRAIVAAIAAFDSHAATCK